MTTFKFNIHKVLKGCTENNRKSQKQLYTNYYSFCYNTCCRLSKNTDDALLILNESWNTIFQKIVKKKYKSPFEHWAKHIIILTVIELYKSEKNWFEPEVTVVVNTERNNINIDQMPYRKVLEAIQSLPSGKRIVFNLSVIDNYSMDDIEALVNLKTGTGNSFLQEAKSMLMTVLNQNIISS